MAARAAVDGGERGVVPREGRDSPATCAGEPRARSRVVGVDGRGRHGCGARAGGRRDGHARDADRAELLEARHVLRVEHLGELLLVAELVEVGLVRDALQEGELLAGLAGGGSLRFLGGGGAGGCRCRIRQRRDADATPVAPAS